MVVLTAIVLLLAEDTATVNTTFRVLACAGMYLPCILCQEFLKGFNNKFDSNFDLLPTILNYYPMAHWEWDS